MEIGILEVGFEDEVGNVLCNERIGRTKVVSADETNHQDSPKR